MPEATYTTEFGYKVSVRLVRDVENDRVHVHVIAPIYMEKEWVMSHCYSCSFTDHQILNDSDFHRVMSRAYRKEH